MRPRADDAPTSDACKDVERIVDFEHVCGVACGTLSVESKICSECETILQVRPADLVRAPVRGIAPLAPNNTLEMVEG